MDTQLICSSDKQLIFFSVSSWNIWDILILKVFIIRNYNLPGHPFSILSSWTKVDRRCQFCIVFFCFCFLFVCLVFLGSHLEHMEVPRLRAELELQLQAYITATAVQDPSCVCDLQDSWWQCCFLNPLSNARDRTCVSSWMLVGFITTEPGGELYIVSFWSHG